METLQETDKLAPITQVELQIIRLKSECGNLKINGLEDKAGFDKVVAKRKETKGYRVGVENARKALVEDSVKWQKQVNETAKGFRLELEAIEFPLQKMEDDYLLEKQLAKEAVELARKEKIQDRARVITSLDAVFNGVSYTLGSVTITQNQLESFSDSDFQTQVEALEGEYKLILDARLESERIAKEEADRLEAQRKEQEAAAAEIKRQQEELEKAQKELEIERARQNDIAEALKIEKRRAQLASIGLVESDSGTHRYKGEVVVSSTLFNNLSDERWIGELVRVGQDLERIDSDIAEKEAKAKEAEEKRLSDLEAARVEAAEEARVDAVNKAKADAEAKIEAERLAKEKEERKAAKRPDIEKFKDMCVKVKAIAEGFEFKTEEGRLAHIDYMTGIELLAKSSKLS